MDPMLLIAIGGMLLAAVVAAIFLRGNRNQDSADAPDAKIQTLYADPQAELVRYHCPHCDEILHQGAHLLAEKPHRQKTNAESGYLTGTVTCPACGQSVRITPKDPDFS